MSSHKRFLALPILATSFVCSVGHAQEFDAVVARFTSAGVLDKAFGGKDGYFRNTLSGDDNNTAVAVDGNRSVVAAGYYTTPEHEQISIVGRRLANGDVDDNFGFLGVTPIHYPTTGWTQQQKDDWSELGPMSIVMDGTKIVMLLRAADGTNERSYLLRLSSNGWADETFGSGGFKRVEMPDHSQVLVGRAIVQSDSKILVCGTSPANGPKVFRYKTNGQLDLTFGDNKSGIASLPMTGVNAIALDGTKIVAAGYTTVGTTSRVGLARILTSGAPDTVFGGNSNGKVTINVPGGTLDGAGSLVVDGSHRPIVVGGSPSDTTFTSFILRTTAAGVLDDKFDTDGIILNPSFPGTNIIQLSDIARDSNGKILITGVGAAPGATDITSAKAVLIRYRTDGTADPGFGDGDGIVTTSSSGGGWAWQAVRPDGDLPVVVGTFIHD